MGRGGASERFGPRGGRCSTGRLPSNRLSVHGDDEPFARAQQTGVDDFVPSGDRSGQITFGEWAEHHMTGVGHRLARTSSVCDRSRLDNHGLPRGGDRRRATLAGEDRRARRSLGHRSDNREELSDLRAERPPEPRAVSHDRPSGFLGGGDPPEASATTGLDDFGDQWFEGPLEAWAADLRQVNLTDFGHDQLRRAAVSDLARRLRVLQTLRDVPAIANVRIPPIIYVTGLERSGTTLLHNLLAQHTRARAMLRWELEQPLPPPETQTYESDPRIGFVQSSIDTLRGSVFERMHWVNADEPEECVFGFIDVVSMLGQAAAFFMPRWRRFLVEEDLRPAFENYRRLLQILLWKHPVDSDGFLVLKSPQVATHIVEFAEVFPEARFVIPDRDPFRCVVSMASMVHALAEPFCHVNPLDRDGARDRLALSWVEPKFEPLTKLSSGQPARV